MLSEECNGNFLKMHVSEIRVKWIRVNQALGVYHFDFKYWMEFNACAVLYVLGIMIDCICKSCHQGLCPKMQYKLYIKYKHNVAIYILPIVNTNA